MAKNSKYNRELREKQKKTSKWLSSLLPSYVLPFIQEKELTMQPNTVIAYERDLLTFFEFLISQNPILQGSDAKQVPQSILEKLDFNDINEYQRYLSYHENTDGDKGHNNQEKAISRRMSALRGFFEYSCTHDIMKNNPTVGAAKRKKMPKKDIVRLEANEVSELFSCMESGSNMTHKEQVFAEKTRYRDTAIITLLLNTGIRVSECVGLDINDVNFRDRTITVVRKGGNEAKIYFNDDTSATLMEYIELERDNYMPQEKEEALFLSRQKRRITVRAVENLVKKYASRAIPDKNISPHKLRSTYGTALYKQTGDIRLVADVLGHTDINTTAKHYAAIAEDHRKHAAEIRLY